MTIDRTTRRRKRPSRKLRRLVADASHDFRTPLAVINEYVSLLRDGLTGATDDGQTRALHAIEERADDLNDMVDDLLNATRLETDTLGAYGRSCRVADLVDELYPRLTRKADLKQFEWDLDIPDDLPDVYCDAEQIGRLIVNLTVIAAKLASRPARVRVWGRYCPDRREVAVGVSDNAAAIDPQAIGCGRSKSVQRALRVARAIVRCNLGEMSTKYTVGDGVAFGFSLPLDDLLEVMRRYADRIARSRNRSRRISIVKVAVAVGADDRPVHDTGAFLRALLCSPDLSFQVDRRLWLVALAGGLPRLERLSRRAADLRRLIDRNGLGEPSQAIEMTPLGTWQVPCETLEVIDTIEKAFPCGCVLA